MNYYNEFDPNMAAWLRQLIAWGLIPRGVVDERSITDVPPPYLSSFTQCHLFAGIGGWPLALELAGWPSDKPVWTGSCPCQPYSVAGKSKGDDDDRNLWPAFFNLIRECSPDTIFGEQVEAAIGHGWLDGLRSDLEGEGYAVGDCTLGAHSAGADHQRQRLYWVADSGRQRDERRRESGIMAGAGGKIEGEAQQRQRGRNADSDSVPTGPMADGISPGLEGHAGYGDHRDQPGRVGTDPAGSVAEGGSISAWSDSTAILCRDGKRRRVPTESLLLDVAHGVPSHLDLVRPCGFTDEEFDAVRTASRGYPLSKGVPHRAALLKGAGNAITPEVAEQFIRAYLAV